MNLLELVNHQRNRDTANNLTAISIRVDPKKMMKGG